ncbi:MAG TPA: MotA/TolQ/ExbB proton channel family protein [Gammaproteobacteria bacterium]|nr:MotA/TolQ/ExbB proton channel family protein [Gammaproteobacteria bacterium]
MTGTRIRIGVRSRLERLRLALCTGLAAAVLIAPCGVLAQGDKASSGKGDKKAAQAAAANPQQVFQQLQQQIQALRTREAKLMQQKEAEAQERLAKQQEQTRRMIARRDYADAISKELDRQWEVNDKKLAELTDLLKQQQGNLGELFGVTRQTAGDAARALRESLISTQLKPPPGQEERAEFMVRITAEKTLPSTRELERLWFELLREITMAGEVVRYQAEVRQIEDNQSVTEEVVRIGSFTAISGDEYLGYLPSATKLTELDGHLAARFRDIADNLVNTPPDAGYTKAVVDPTSGALLGLYLQRPNWLQRIARGEVIGYVIIAVGILGVLLALYQYGYLVKTRSAVHSQLEKLSKPQDDNPLGRLLLAFRGGHGEARRAPESAELAELRLSEAVLREVPQLERFQSFLRLAVSAGPLLGLIGTVIGMIITFHSIVASGTSDPRFMAHGIGQAMIATVLGLGIAIPLLFINSGLVALSRGIMQILDEQSALLLADTIGENRKGGDKAHKGSESHKRNESHKKTPKHK